MTTVKIWICALESALPPLSSWTEADLEADERSLIDEVVVLKRMMSAL
jgi:hypothetical protein